MTLLSTRAGRHYTESDLAFAIALAERCALAIDNARLHDRAERSLSLLDTVFSTAPVGLALVDRDLRFVRVNETFAAFNDRPVHELVGCTVPELLRARGRPEADVIPSYERVLSTGEAVLDRELTTAPPEGATRHWNASFTPVMHADGSVTGVIVSVVDVTERRALLEAERDARVRADFLARAGAILDASLDYEETLRSVAQIAIPEVADWCAVSVLDDAGVLQEVATAHIDEAQRELGAEITRRFPPDPSADTGAYGVARSGETAFVSRDHRRDARGGDTGSRAPRPHPPPRPALGHHRGAQGARPRLRHLQPGQRRVRPALRRRRPPAGRGARRARRDGDRQRAALHRAQPDRPHPPGQAPARAPARDPAGAHGRPLPRGRRAQRGRRRLLRRLPALADRVGARGRRRVGQGRRGRRRHGAGPLHAARRGARGRAAQRRPASA